MFNADNLEGTRDRLSEAVAHLDGRLGKVATGRGTTMTAVAALAYGAPHPGPPQPRARPSRTPRRQSGNPAPERRSRRVDAGRVVTRPAPARRGTQPPVVRVRVVTKMSAGVKEVARP